MSAFQPAQKQRWNLYAGFEAAMASPSARGELRGWCGLALLSLAIAGVFALLLAVSRVPGISDIFPWPLQFFDKGLVIHVVFSFVVWFLSILGALLTIAAHRLGDGHPGGGGLARLALWASYAAQPLMFVPGLLDRGEASLNNYVPVIIDPLYYAGLGLLAVGLLLAVVRFIGVMLRRSGPMEPLAVGSLIASLIYLLALVCFAIAGVSLSGDAIDGAFNENLFWGGGHILQFLNVSLMLSGWYVLGGLSLEKPAMRPQMASLTQVLLLASAVVGPMLYILFDAFSYDQMTSFTWLQYLLAPPTLLAAMLILQTIRQSSPLPHANPAFKCLVLSVVVFGVGGFLGLFVDGADTRTPAHYHGVIGGVNLVFIGLFLSFFLPLMDRGLVIGRAVTGLIHMYAWGQVLASIGLFLAGGYGAPRKTAGDAQGLEAMGAVMGMYLNGIGALIAIIGGIMFIWITAKALLRRA
jgi:cytochrome c oxidase subunit I